MKIIGEIAQAHDGSLGTAHALIDCVADAGADAVKFQTHIAAAESSPEEPWRKKFSEQDVTRFDYWRRMEFTREQWVSLKHHAEDRGLVFMSSPFSEAAVDLLEALGVTIWKIPSGETSNPILLEKILSTGKPVLVSSGISTWADLDQVVDRLRTAGVEFAVLQCTTSYPTPPEQVGLNVLEDLRQRYQCAVGLSDHSGTIYPGLAAATLGADWLEVHVTLSRAAFGPDVSSSLTPAELAQLAEDTRWIERARAHPVQKDELRPELRSMQSIFTQSLIVTRDLAPGDTVERADISSRKPGTGIPVTELDAVIGRRLAQAVSAGSFLAESDFAPSS